MKGQVLTVILLVLGLLIITEAEAVYWENVAQSQRLLLTGVNKSPANSRKQNSEYHPNGAKNDYTSWPSWIQAIGSLGAVIIAGVAVRIQLKIASRQNEFSERQVALEERAFRIEHRARLVIDGITVFHHDERTIVHFNLTNIGEENALITGISCFLYVIDLPNGIVGNTTANKDGLFAQSAIHSGGVILATVEFEKVKKIYGNRSGESETFLHGHVYYQSGKSIRWHDMGFDYVSRGKSPVFNPTPESLRNYDR